MTEANIDKIMLMNQRLLLVMGYATSVILDLHHHIPIEKKEGCYWVVDAMENIVYLDKPLPPMPGVKK